MVTVEEHLRRTLVPGQATCAEAEARLRAGKGHPNSARPERQGIENLLVWSLLGIRDKTCGSFWTGTESVEDITVEGAPLLFEDRERMFGALAQLEGNWDGHPFDQFGYCTHRMYQDALASSMFIGHANRYDERHR